MPLEPKQQPPYYNTQGTNVKIYAALITQEGTSPPTARILQNTLGEIPTFIYGGPGHYEITKTTLFPWGTFQAWIGDENSPNGKNIILDGEDGNINIKTYGVGGSQANDLLFNTPLKIELYTNIEPII